MRTDVVMDTNVAVVANGAASHAGPDCEDACLSALERIRNEHRLVLDNQGAIVGEYRKRLRPAGQPGPGDAFFKWLWDHQANESFCVMVAVTPNKKRAYLEFPEDSDLADLHWDDRKFVAVACAAGTSPPILNASDTDWLRHHEALGRHGVRVNDLCPELMRRNGRRAAAGRRSSRPRSAASTDH